MDGADTDPIIMESSLRQRWSRKELEMGSRTQIPGFQFQPFPIICGTLGKSHSSGPQFVHPRDGRTAFVFLTSQDWGEHGVRGLKQQVGSKERVGSARVGSRAET